MRRLALATSAALLASSPVSAQSFADKVKAAQACIQVLDCEEGGCTLNLDATWRASASRDGAEQNYLMMCGADEGKLHCLFDDAADRTIDVITVSNAHTAEPIGYSYTIEDYHYTIYIQKVNQVLARCQTDKPLS